MKTELQTQLVGKYKPILSGLDWGIECEDGWYWLLDQLCYSIQSEVENANTLWPALKFSVRAVQVKPKYGSLRFYVDFISAQNLEDHDYDKIHKYMDRISGMISFAERMSGTICEVCGQPGKASKHMYPRTLCEQHFDNKETSNV